LIEIERGQSPLKVGALVGKTKGYWYGKVEHREGKIA
jgi:hypothetical protein